MMHLAMHITLNSGSGLEVPHVEESFPPAVSVVFVLSFELLHNVLRWKIGILRYNCFLENKQFIILVHTHRIKQTFRSNFKKRKVWQMTS